jgi:hypothetical protein
VIGLPKLAGVARYSLVAPLDNRVRETSPRWKKALLLPMILLTACGARTASEISPRASSAPSCVEVWNDTRAATRASGFPDGEARRRADLARAACEGLSPEEYPEGELSSPPVPPCAEEGSRRDAPPPADPSRVAVYFSCGADIGARELPVYMLERSVPESAGLEARLKEALDAYLEGPNDKELKDGYTTALGESANDVLRNVRVDGGDVTIDFTAKLERFSFPTTAGDILIRELSALTFQFSEVARLHLLVNGSCEQFWQLLERGCQVLERGN